MHPVANAQERFEQLAALLGGQRRLAKERLASQNVFVFEE
jgi:hypothetical protein